MVIADDKENAGQEPEVASEDAGKDKPEGDGHEDNGILSQKNIASDTEVPADDVSLGPTLGLSSKPRAVIIKPQDKKDFIDSVVNNSRFEKSYSIFGGKLNVVIRSLTSAELQALSAWVLKQSALYPSMQISGAYRKFLLSAQVSMFNGTEIPPMEEPLFETLEKDGKTLTPPGWVDKCKFWDDKGAAVVHAVTECVKDFDRIYSTLCRKAEDENFWGPDTP